MDKIQRELYENYKKSMKLFKQEKKPLSYELWLKEVSKYKNSYIWKQINGEQQDS